MSHHMERAFMLLGQSRYELAEQEVRQSLLADPDEPTAHAVLALCLAELDQYEEATHEAETAIHYAPDMAFGHYALARVYLERNRHKEARTAIEEALRLEPEDADFYSVKAASHLGLRNWQAALNAAVEGLAVDPEHVACANLRAMALVNLGRKAEAHASLDATLSKAPEDTYAHANKGWALLHQRRPREAMEHFREALRLDPENEYARGGMVEALKARFFIYRWLLTYFLWMSRLSRKAQWAVILGLYFVPKFLRGVARDNPDLQVWILPVVVVAALFCILTWIADPLFNMLLRLSRFGRYALSREQMLASNALLACLCGIVVSCAFGYFAGSMQGYLAAFVFLLMMVPVTNTLRMEADWRRKALMVYTGLLATLAICGVILLDKPEQVRQSEAVYFLGIWLLGVFLYGWIANGLAMMRVRK